MLIFLLYVNVHSDYFINLIVFKAVYRLHVDFPRIIQNLYQMTYNSQAILVRTDNKLQGQLLCLMFRGISVQRDTPLASDDVTKIYLLAYLLRRCP